MKMQRLQQKHTAFLLALLTVLLLSGIALTRAHRAQADVSVSLATSSAPQPVIEPSNYCQSCHSGQDLRLQSAAAWRGGSASHDFIACPAVARIQEQQFYTERLLLAIDHGMAVIGSQAKDPAIQSRHQAVLEGYARLLDEPIESLNAFESEAQTLRYQMGKLYTQINAHADAQQKQTALVFAIAVTLIVLASLAWGFYNTHKMHGAPASKPQPTYYLLTGVFLLLVFGLFVLPLFRPVVAEVENPTAEEQAIATAHDTASRLASTADRADSRAWMFGRIAAALNAQQPDLALKALESGLDAAANSKDNDYALWGEAAHVNEVSVGEKAKLESAGLIASQLNASRSRAWALALIGAEWAQVNPQEAEVIFKQALTTAQNAQGIYRDLDLRKIAVEWARLDPARGLEVIPQIADPALKSWALREIATQTGDDKVFAQAAEAARQVQDPVQRARLLSEIAVLNHDSALFQEGLAALQDQQGAARAYALANLAAASADPALVNQIDPRYAAARTLALLHLGQYIEAWEASSGIKDPYERARAEAEIAAAWAGVSSDLAAQKAQEIQVPSLRDRAVRDVILRTGNASLVESLSLAYYRVQAFTALSQFNSAWESAATLKEPFPLVKLGQAWAQKDPDSAAQVLDALAREADKALVLRTLADITRDPQIFERALGMAQAARVRNNPLASAVASLDLQTAAASPDHALRALLQALEITERISIK